MELNLVETLIANSMTNLETSCEACNSDNLGLVIKYDSIEYRGQEIEILSDPSGDQRFAKWNNELIDLGLNNTYYKEDLCRFIDRRLDLITEFRDLPDFAGAKLEYFNNGGCRDIKLSYRGRVIKVFLVAGSVNEIWVISESKKLLLNSGLLENNFENL
jgi:hypothetical protein